MNKTRKILSICRLLNLSLALYEHKNKIDAQTQHLDEQKANLYIESRYTGSDIKVRVNLRQKTK